MLLRPTADASPGDGAIPIGEHEQITSATSATPDAMTIFNFMMLKKQHFKHLPST